MGKRHFRNKAIKRFMEHGSRAINEIKEDALCVGCKFHRPNWEYRFCRFVECPEFKGAKTFREEYYK